MPSYSQWTWSALHGRHYSYLMADDGQTILDTIWAGPSDPEAALEAVTHRVDSNIRAISAGDTRRATDHQIPQVFVPSRDEELEEDEDVEGSNDEVFKGDDFYIDQKKGKSASAVPSARGVDNLTEDSGDDVAPIYPLCKEVLKYFSQALELDTGWAWSDESLAVKLHEASVQMLHWDASLRWLVAKVYDTTTQSGGSTPPTEDDIQHILDQTGSANPYLAGVIASYLEDIRQTLSSIQSICSPTLTATDVPVAETLKQDLESSVQCLGLQLTPMETVLKDIDLTSDFARKMNVSSGHDTSHTREARGGDLRLAQSDELRKGKATSASLSPEDGLRHTPHEVTVPEDRLDASDDASTMRPQAGRTDVISNRGWPPGSSPSIPSFRQIPSSSTRADALAYMYHDSPKPTGIPAAGHVRRFIQTGPDSSPTESLDEKYRRVANTHHATFFVPGRVFKMLWIEPAGVVNPGTTRNSTHFSTVWLGEQAYCEIRPFVVVRNKGTFSQCIPIQTYGGRGATKPGIIVSDHGIIHTSPKPPNMTRGEHLTKYSIRVEPTGTETLHPASRVNYGKVYAVEHNVKVLDIGMVMKDHQYLIASYYEEAMRA